MFNMDRVNKDDQQHLIELNQWLISGLDILAELSKSFQSDVSQNDDYENVYQLTIVALNKLVETKSVAFLSMANDGINLNLNSCHPLNQKSFFDKVIDDYSDNGTIGWALCENRLVVVPDKKRNCTLLIHVLATAKTVYGLFIATTDMDIYITDATQKLISVMLLNTAHAIESQQFTREIIANERMKQEISSAAKIQEQLLPNRSIEMQSCLMYGHCQPSAQIGGDYYDYILTKDDLIYFALCDIAGHGVAAGLFMTMIKSIFRTLVNEGLSPVQITTQLNTFLKQEIPDPQIYATGIFGQYDIHSRKLIYSVAGHPAPLLIRKGELSPLSGSGMAMGLIEDITYTQTSVTLKKTDTVVFFTDGLYELRNTSDEMLQEQDFQNWIKKIDWTSQIKSVNQLQNNIENFTRIKTQADDQTLLVLYAR